MRIRGLGRVRQAARWTRNLLRPTAAVLMYHRVADLERDPQALAVSPQNFDAQMACLRRLGEPCALRDLPSFFARRGRAARAVVVTFDDGYADNVENAAPILLRHRIPATMFVTSGFIDSAREPWWDELDRILLGGARLPRELTLMIKGETHTWTLGEGVPSTTTAAGWNVLAGTSPSARHSAYRELSSLLRPLDAGEREAALEALRAWSGLKKEARASHRMMTSSEVRSVAAGGLVEIGAHAVTHPYLSALPPQRQTDEVAQSRRALEGLLDREVSSFAYPFGGPDAYDRHSVEAVAAAGFQRACTTRPGLANAGSPALELPRLPVRDWDGAEFLRRVRASAFQFG